MNSGGKPVSKVQRWLHKPASVKLQAVAYTLARWLDARRDRALARRHGLDFAGLIQPADLGSAHPHSQRHANTYEPFDGMALRTVLYEAMRSGTAFTRFIDIGSGKGKACLYAARSLGLPEVLGVEFSPPLIAIARANAQKLGLTQVRFVEADAAQFQLPDGPNLVFLFNPFDQTILEAFLANNLAHFQRHGSVIAYGNDRDRAVLARFGFATLYRDQVLKLSVHAWSDRAQAGTASAVPAL